MAPQLTFYGHKDSPFAEKVELALLEGNIPHKLFLIDFANKPAFFTELNPLGKVPTITYGGPDVPPDEPSPLSIKLTESNVILEFLAEVNPEAKLMPTDPVQRARVRLLMDALTRKYMPAFMEWILDREPHATEKHLGVIEFLQGLLGDSRQYAVGDSYTIADAAITPFIRRLRLSIEHDIGKFPVGNGPKFGELLKDPKYAKFMTYASTITSRPVTKANWDRKYEHLKGAFTMLFGRESTFEMPLAYIRATG